MSEDSQLCSQIDSILARLDRRMEEAKTISPYKEAQPSNDFGFRLPLNSKQSNKITIQEAPQSKAKTPEPMSKSGIENESAQERAQKIGELFFSNFGKILNTQPKEYPEQPSGTFKVPEHHRLESFGKVTFVQEVKLADAIQMQSQHQKQPSFGQKQSKITDNILRSISKSPIREKPSSKDNSPFQPQLSKRSMVLAKRLGSAKERLLTQPNREAHNNTETMTFKPEINKRSEKIVNKINPQKTNRWETLYNKGNEQRIKHEKLRKAAEEAKNEDKECTFKPNITPVKERPENQNTVERLLNWGKIKDQKIKQKRDNDLEKGLEGCTFVPQINDLKYYIDEDVSGLRGVSKFLDRQVAARKIKEERLGSKEEYIPEQDSATTSAYVSTMSKDITMQDFTEAIESLHEELHSFQI